MIGLKFLQCHALFGGLTDEDIKIIRPLLKEEHFSKGQVIVEEGMNVFRILLVLSMIVAVGCRKKQHDEEAIESRSVGAREKSAGAKLVVDHAEFEQMGHYSDERMDGYTFFVTNPNMEDIERFCEQKKDELCRRRKALKIRFFDSREQILDISSEFSFPRSSDQHCVMDFFFDSRMGLTEITPNKKIPAGPEVRNRNR